MCAAKIYLSLSNECDGDLEAMPVVAAVNNFQSLSNFDNAKSAISECSKAPDVRMILREATVGWSGSCRSCII